MSMTLSQLLDQFIASHGTDLYLTVGTPPLMRDETERLVSLHSTKLDEPAVQQMAAELLGEEGMDEFDSTLEYNTAIDWNDKARFRLNVYKQRQKTGLVLRRVSTEIPTIKELGLPPIYEQLAMEKRGLVLIVGPTGSGKSTSMAAMIDHRNQRSSGHIMTIEDPVEYIHDHGMGIVSQRDIGIDTYSYGIALKNVLRQRPDVIVIGEIRDRDTMEHAIKFSETGHLCIATLHAGNSLQTLERIVSFFPEDKHKQVLLALSINLKAVLSQRLVGNAKGKRSLANEIMLNQGLIRNLIHDGTIKDIPAMIEKSAESGMITFDKSLMELVESGKIDESTAVKEADNVANIKLYITRNDMNQRVGAAADKEIRNKTEF